MNLERAGECRRQGAADVSSAEMFSVSSTDRMLAAPWAHGEPSAAFAHDIGTMNRSGPKVGQASRLPRERASASGTTTVWSASPTGQAGRLPYLAVHGEPPFVFSACIGTMNPRCA